MRSIALLLFACTAPLAAQTPAVSDFGTSFGFSAPPVCHGCAEAEVGAGFGAGRWQPVVVGTFGVAASADLSAILSRSGAELALRRLILDRGGFAATIAPLASVGGGVALGGALAVQRTTGALTLLGNAQALRNLGRRGGAAQLTGDCFLTLGPRGASPFVGAQRAWAAGRRPSLSLEHGWAAPFHGGQAEADLQALDITRRPGWLLEVRLIAVRASASH